MPTIPPSRILFTINALCFPIAVALAVASVFSPVLGDAGGLFGIFIPLGIANVGRIVFASRRLGISTRRDPFAAFPAPPWLKRLGNAWFTIAVAGALISALSFGQNVYHRNGGYVENTSHGQKPISRHTYLVHQNAGGRFGLLIVSAFIDVGVMANWPFGGGSGPDAGEADADRV